MSEGLRLYLFDDERGRYWAPFTLTRPAGELLFGRFTLRERAERALGLRCVGHLSRPRLEGFDEPDGAPVLPREAVDPNHARVLLSSRVVPPLDAAVELPPGPARLTVAGQVVGWVLPPGAPLPDEGMLLDPSSGPAAGEAVELGGSVLDRPWTLVALNPTRLATDLETLGGEESEPSGVVRVGGGTLSLGPGAEIEPGVYVDTRGGPVRLEAGARVEGPARLVGPLWLGPDSLVFGGTVAASSIGPTCKVRGELTESVLLGFDNKAHDGYLGHAYLGRWVNLGAYTTNSDLKNNYGSVRVWTLDGERDTGLMKVGCFLGDHVKTGIGTVLNTGTVVGAGSNVYGGVMPPSVVPPFSWGAGADLRDYRLDKFLETAERAMSRRDQPLTPGVRRILTEAWAATAGRRAE